MQQLRRPWTAQEDQAVAEIVKNIGLKNWPLVSSLMKQNYEIVGRSGKQCRERWYNQINPEVNKKPWTYQQQNLLFEAHKKYKNKWIQISKLFIGRTDNSIKNHFYSTIRRSLRRICKLLGNKNSTSQLRSIKPSILSQIFEYSQMNRSQVTAQNQSMVQDSKMLTQQLLNFSRMKQKPQGEEKSANKEKLEFIIQKLNHFSQNYETIKNHNKKTVLSNGRYIRKTTQQSASIQSLKKKMRNLKDSTKTQKKMLNESSIYDWDQFQRKCMFVKYYLMENQNQIPEMEETPIIDHESQVQSMPLFGFFTQEKDKEAYRTQTMTPRSQNYNRMHIQKRRGFQIYNYGQKMFQKQQYDCLVQDIKNQISGKNLNNSQTDQKTLV